MVFWGDPDGRVTRSGGNYVNVTMNQTFGKTLQELTYANGAA